MWSFQLEGPTWDLFHSFSKEIKLVFLQVFLCENLPPKSNLGLIVISIKNCANNHKMFDVFLILNISSLLFN
jgi:hypothetical protein